MQNVQIDVNYKSRKQKPFHVFLFNFWLLQIENTMVFNNLYIRVIMKSCRIQGFLVLGDWGRGRVCNRYILFLLELIHFVLYVFWAESPSFLISYFYLL